MAELRYFNGQPYTKDQFFLASEGMDLLDLQRIWEALEIVTTAANKFIVVKDPENRFEILGSFNTFQEAADYSFSLRVEWDNEGWDTEIAVYQKLEDVIPEADVQ